MDVAVKVTNLAQFSRALKQVDADLPGDLRSSLKELAEPIAASVRGKVPVRSGKARASVKTRASQRGAAIAAGGTKAPYFHWLDFGGTTGRGHKLGPRRGSVKREWKGRPNGSGRYVYPTISEYRDETRQAVGRAIAKSGRSAGFEVR